VPVLVVVPVLLLVSVLVPVPAEFQPQAGILPSFR
jgi:hypothetical protein